MSLKVIGAGFGRTGTFSLKLALEQLGFGPCYHMVEALKVPGAPQKWEAAADGNPDWADIFAGYQATVDWPGATFWRELAQEYSDAPVILTLRDPEAWYESTQATIFSRDFDDPDDPWQCMVRKVIGRLFDGRMHDRDHLIEVFNRHNEAVKSAIPAERLLVYNVAEGWGPLCSFLGVEEPDGPIPKTNAKEDFGKFAEELERSSDAGGAPGG